MSNPTMTQHLDREPPPQLRQPKKGPHRGATATSLTMTVLGALALIILVVMGIFTIDPRDAYEAELSASTDGMKYLHVDSAAAHVEVRYGDTDEAKLQLSGTIEDDWSFERTGEALELRQKDVLAFCIFNCGIAQANLILTLPRELADRELVGDFSVSSGSVSVVGDYADIVLRVDAGSGSWDGRARSAHVVVNAGKAEVRAHDLDRADFSVSAGSLHGTVKGQQPTMTELTVGAGAMNVELPDGGYRVISDVAAGTIDEQLQHDNASNHRVSINVSAGKATVR